MKGATSNHTQKLHGRVHNHIKMTHGNQSSVMQRIMKNPPLKPPKEWSILCEWGYAQSSLLNLRKKTRMERKKTGLLILLNSVTDGLPCCRNKRRKCSASIMVYYFHPANENKTWAGTHIHSNSSKAFWGGPVRTSDTNEGNARHERWSRKLSWR